MSEQHAAVEGESPRRICIWFEPVTEADLSSWRRRGIIIDDEILAPRYDSVLRAIERYREGSEADQLFWLHVVASMIVDALTYIELAQRGSRWAAGPNVPTMDELAGKAIEWVKRLAFEQAERLLTNEWGRWAHLRSLWVRHIPSLPPEELAALAKTWREIAEAARAKQLAVESQAKTQQTAEAQQPVLKANGRGRLPKDVHQEKYATFMNVLRDHPSLKDDPGLLAEKVGVSRKTIRCWLAEAERRYRESRVNHPEADELD